MTTNTSDVTPETIQTAIDVLAWLLTESGAGGTYSMTCDEVEALAAALAAAGHRASAARALQTHAICDSDPGDRHAHLHPSLDNAEADALALATALSDGIAASAAGLWFDRSNRCRACGEHQGNPHALGCPGSQQ